MVSRILADSLLKAGAHYPIVSLTGPRQSGKTTLIRSLWPEKTYASLEDPDILDYAREDPRRFLEQGTDSGLIIDEAQRLPVLFGYLQGYADRSPHGRYVLSGSNNFLLMEKITQTLAGRTAVLHLMPFSAREIGSDHLTSTWEEEAFAGFYPRVRAESLPPAMFAKDYLATYVERDVRLVRNISDVDSFRRFLHLCAGRTGQLLNLTALSGDTGIAVNTVKDWLSVLQASWTVFLLRPWHRNFNKRVVKSPKIYWHDTSLLCSLLGIQDHEALQSHPFRGAVFENLIIAERYKAATHAGRSPDLYFWRDSAGKEVDIVESPGTNQVVWECKSGLTVNSDFFRNLGYFGNLASIPPERRILAYGGSEAQDRSAARVLGWKDAVLFDDV